MNDIIDGVLSGWVTICIEESKRKVRARIDGNSYSGVDLVVRAGRCFRAPNWTLVVGIAYFKLIPYIVSQHLGNELGLRTHNSWYRL